MQIELINRNSIIGLVGNSGSGKSTFISYFKPSKKVGVINYDTVKESNVRKQLYYYVMHYKYKINELDSRFNEIIKMLSISEDILDKSIYEISDSELTKVLIGSVLLYNPDFIIVDELLNDLDDYNKEKIFKLFMKLKKFFNKTIIVVTSDIDYIFEYIDDVIIIDEGKVLLYGNKFEVYNNNYELLLGKKIRIPEVIQLKEKMKKKGYIIDNCDSINELIKAIYRCVR
jgi:energy-coupling factor transport system ATP-binding protein